MIKKLIKFILPRFTYNFLKIHYERLREKNELKKFKKLNIKEIFHKIYEDKLWTPEIEKNNFKYYSGLGSHSDEFTSIYANKVKEFLLTFSSKPSVVDLGCGDFAIGSKIRKYCDKYFAIDIFDKLININKKKYSNLNVDFSTLDITEDQLPSADICFVRQVLQHLSNDSIKKFLNLSFNKYKYLIITEHIPKEHSFKANIDINTGPYIRINKNSGVVLTKQPFNLKVIIEKNICNIYPQEIIGFKGVINTKIYQLYK